MNNQEAIDLIYYEGIDFYSKEIEVTISLDDENNRLTITPKYAKVSPVHLAYDQITKCATINNEMVTEKNKSVVGRAIVGGVLTGGLGAIVGGMTGIGSKKKVKKIYYFVINYINKEGDTSVLSFRVDHVILIMDFVKALQDRINKNKIIGTETYL